MQFSSVFFTIASALLFMAPAVNAIACDKRTLQVLFLLCENNSLTFLIIVAACNISKTAKSSKASKGLGELEGLGSVRVSVEMKEGV